MQESIAFSSIPFLFYSFGKNNVVRKDLGTYDQLDMIEHEFLLLDAQALNAKERHFILPLVIATFIMQSIAFISPPSQDRTKLIFPQ